MKFALALAYSLYSLHPDGVTLELLPTVKLPLTARSMWKAGNVHVAEKLAGGNRSRGRVITAGVVGLKSTVRRSPVFCTFSSLAVVRKRLFTVRVPSISVYVEVPLRSAFRQLMSSALKLVEMYAATVPAVREDDSVKANTS